MPGRFITLEGIEGSGKTTQMAFVQQFLSEQNIELIVTREPGGTELGEKIRELLLSNELPNMHSDTELMLMFAARIEHVKRVIEPALNSGQWVLSDRFFDATYAYQGFGREIDISRIDTLLEFSVADLKPDLTLLLDIDLELSEQRVSQRGSQDRFEKEKKVFYEKVRKGYLTLAEQENNRIKVIDASQSIEAVKLDITSQLQVLIKARDL